MINPKNKNQITFPHTIPTAILNGKTYVWNDVNGGAKPIGAFGLLSNSFWGGRVNILGLVKELGFWAALDKNDPKRQKVLGFYLANPKDITELGKWIISEIFPGYEMLYIMHEDLPTITEDPEARKKLNKEAMDMGVLGGDFKHISRASVGTLKSLIESAKYDQEMEREPTVAENAIVEPEPDVATDLIKQAKARKAKSVSASA